MMKEYKGDFVAIGLDCKGAKQNFLDTSTNVARYAISFGDIILCFSSLIFYFRMTSFHIEPTLDSEKHYLTIKWNSLTTFLEENRQNIFYLFIFYVITIALFVERFIRK